MTINRHERILNHLDIIAKNVEPVAAARIAAAIVFRNEIVAIGFNRLKTHPFQSKYSSCESAIYLHAENDAIVKSLRLLSLEQMGKARLYISRLKYDDAEQYPKKNKLKRGLARPCCGCMRSIAAMDIRQVCYTCDDGYEWL